MLDANGAGTWCEDKSGADIVSNIRRPVGAEGGLGLFKYGASTLALTHC